MTDQKQLAEELLEELECCGDVGEVTLLMILDALAAILATASPAAPPCTHGVSSAGPAVIADGKLVSNPKPHTERCLP